MFKYFETSVICKSHNQIMENLILLGTLKPVTIVQRNTNEDFIYDC